MPKAKPGRGAKPAVKPRSRAPERRPPAPVDAATQAPRRRRSDAMRLAAEVERLERELAVARSQMAALEARADIDPLTDLPNRRAFERELVRSLAYVKRHGTDATLLYVDLDDFKRVNDRHGHSAGDAVLRAVASVLGRHVRASDVVARIGGDEFAVLLWNCAEANALAKGARAGSGDRAHHRDARRRSARGRRFGRRRRAVAARPAGGHAAARRPRHVCAQGGPRARRGVTASRGRLTGPGTMCHIRMQPGIDYRESHVLSVRWRIRCMRQLALVAAALLALSPAAAQNPAADYPNKPVRIIVANPAGGGVDTVTRVFAERLHQKFGQAFVIENRGGAGGNIGADAVYGATPDGYTLMTSAPSPITANIFLYKKLSFDPSRFEPVAVLGSFPNTLLVKNDFPAKTVQEFIAYVKANPGKVNYASQGNGTTSHLTAELYNTLAGVKMVHVPYRGTGPALNDIVAGHVDLVFMQLSSSVRLHEGKKARILAVTTEKRLPILKDIPTMIEAGIPNFVSDTWNALIGAARDAGRDHRQAQQGDQRDRRGSRTPASSLPSCIVEVTGGSPADLRKLIQEETARWGEVIKKAGIQPE